MILLCLVMIRPRCIKFNHFVLLGFDPNHPEEVPGLFEGDIELEPGENPLVSA